MPMKSTEPSRRTSAARFTPQVALWSLTALVLSACGGAAPSTSGPTTPGGSGATLTVSGTVRATAGADLGGTLVVACGVKDGDCDQDNVRAVRIDGSGETSFRIDGLRPGPYYLIGWNDLNASREIDPGDLVGVYGASGGTPKVIDRSTSGADLTLSKMTAPNGDTIRGTVHTPQGTSHENVVVFTCVVDAEGSCDEGKFVASGVTAQGQYVLEDVPTEPFYVVAWQDANGDNQPGPGDLYGAHLDDTGTVTRVLAPRTTVDVRLGGFPGTAPAKPAPSGLTGTWISGTSTGVDYYNPGTGAWAPPSGTGALLEIHPDGTFTRGVTVQLSNYGCTTTVIGHYSGRVRVSGSNLTLEPTSSRQKYTSSCNSSLNYDREVPNSSLAFTWALDADGRLVLTWPSGGKTYYNRT